MSRFVPDADPEPTPDDIALGKRFRRRNRARRFWQALGALIAVAAMLGAVYFFTLNRLAETESAESPTISSEDAPVVQTTFSIPDEARKATVDYVHDGDTLFINLSGERLKVRLIGIDTPEVGDNLECYGDTAAEVARKLMPEGSTVWALTDGGTEDKYGRSLFYLFTDDGLFVNVSLVARGAAETLLISNNDRYWPELRVAQERAQALGRGVWGNCFSE